MNEKIFSEGLALGQGMKSGLTDDWFILFLIAILLSGNGRSETEVTRKEFENLKADVETLKGGVKNVK